MFVPVEVDSTDMQSKDRELKMKQQELANNRNTLKQY
jgi:hypothetical protein